MSFPAGPVYNLMSIEGRTRWLALVFSAWAT